MNQENDERRILDAIGILARKIDEQNARIGKLEASAGIRPEKVSGKEPADIPREASAAESAGFAVSRQADPGNQEIFSDKDGLESASLEERIGGRWFSKIGIAAIVLGVSFFLKYAFDSGWVNEIGRVLIGLLAGAVMLWLGESNIRKYKSFGQTLSGGGLAVLYLSIFAAFNFYHLVGQLPALFLMSGITAAGIYLSIRYETEVLMLLALFGGFLTPFLISDGRSNEAGLFSYLLILNLAILAVSTVRDWKITRVVGLAMTIILYSSWKGQFYRSEDFLVTMFFLAAFFAIHSLASFSNNILRSRPSSGIEQLTMGLSTAFCLIGGAELIGSGHAGSMFYLYLILAAYHFLVARTIRIMLPEDGSLRFFSDLLAIGLVTLAIPEKLSGQASEMVWLIEGAALMLFRSKAGRVSFRIVGAALMAVSAISVMADYSSYSPTDIVLFNKTFGMHLYLIAVFYAAAFLELRTVAAKRESDAGQDSILPARKAAAAFLIAANLLTVYIGSREIGLHYDNRIFAIRGGNSDRQYGSYPEPSMGQRYGTRDQSVSKIQYQSSVALSLFWMLYGLALLVIGIGKKWKPVRIGGLMLFILAILKLFLYDLWSLGTLYRIISSITLGALLIAISYVYQRNKDKLKGMI